jgi:glycosyltransferase domain-containing protein
VKLTIVITTFNRPDYIKRHLTFLDLNRCIYDIIILDGSNKNNQIKNSNTIHKLKHINVIHRTYPEDMNCAFRIKMGLREISSPYTLLFADDDFILT